MKIVTAALIQKNNNYLLTRRALGEKLAGYWEFPGGKVELGETLEECLTREIKEELSLDIEVGTLFHEVIHEYEGGAITLKAFSCVCKAGELTLTVHDEARWLPATEIIKLNLAPADMPIAEKLIHAN